MFGRRKPAASKPHPPSTALEKGMVALAKRHDLKTISATKNKREAFPRERVPVPRRK